MTVAIGRRRRWRPGPTSKVDWSHELAAGLVACFIGTGGSFVDLVTRSQATPSGDQAGAATATQFGQGTTTACTEPPRPTASLGTCAGVTLTVAFRCGTVPNGTSIKALFGIEHNTGPSCFLRLGDNAGTILFDIGADVKLDTLVVPVSGKEYVVTGRAGPSLKSVWINGTRIVSAANTDTGTVQTTTTIGRGVGILAATDFGFASRWGDSPTTVALWHTRELTDAEVLMLYADPFCMLRF
jgi:hypothetical protein